MYFNNFENNSKKINNLIAALNNYIISIVSKILDSIFIIAVSNNNSSSCVNEYEFERFATGFAIDNNIIVSAAHLNPNTNVCVMNTSGDIFSGRVKSVDEKWDLLFIETDADLKPLELETKLQPIGSIVIACGMPHGLLKPFFSLGILNSYKVNAFINDKYLEGLIVSTTPITIGMSGGPLVDIYGKTIGCIIGSAFNSNEFALSIPSKRIYYSYNILKKYGHVKHIKLGLKVMEYSTKISGISRRVVITKIFNNYLTSYCGIDVGDMIISVENTEVNSIEDLWNILDESLISGKKCISIEFYSSREKNRRICSYCLNNDDLA